VSLKPWVAALASVCLALGACGKSTPTPASASSSPTADTKDDQKPGEIKELSLEEEELAELDVRTQPAQAVAYRTEIIGYGVVVDHQLIAQAVADVQTAEATAKLSQASLERMKQLHSTPGALSTDLEQTAEQKAAVDATALTLSVQKLSSLWGLRPPWQSDVHDARVQALARGATQLVRVTFPLDTLNDTPANLYGGHVGSARPQATANLSPVWLASADATVPGRSFFALVPAGTLAEGERLQAWAPTGKPVSGALIPLAALVMNGGKFWCYLEKSPGTLMRVEVDTSRPATNGYVVTKGIKPGDKIAVTAVAHLLAKETGPADEGDD
jgi:hypothetical protein